MAGYIILLHMCNINEDHMIYDSRNIRCNRQNLLSFWAIFCPCPFTLWTTQKINFLKKWNKCLEILSFYTCSINSNHMIYGSSDMDQNRHTFLSFWTIFLPFYAPNNPKNQNFEDMKKYLETLSFDTCVPKMIIMWCKVPQIWSTTDRIFCHFGPSFALLPTHDPKNQNFVRMKKSIETLSFYTCVP